MRSRRSSASSPWTSSSCSRSSCASTATQRTLPMTILSLTRLATKSGSRRTMPIRMPTTLSPTCPSRIMKAMTPAGKDKLTIASTQVRKTTSSTQARVAKAKAAIVAPAFSVKAKTVVVKTTKADAMATKSTQLRASPPSASGAQARVRSDSGKTGATSTGNTTALTAKNGKTTLGATTKPAQAHAKVLSYDPTRTLPITKVGKPSAQVKTTATAASVDNKTRASALRKPIDKTIIPKGTARSTAAAAKTATTPGSTRAAAATAATTSSGRGVTGPVRATFERAENDDGLKIPKIRYPPRNRIVSMISVRAPVPSAA
ncbi:hypothetical protein V8E36_003847 [Tilletia maclaganii]